MPKRINYCIYGLHKGDGVIRYVGRSKYGTHRLSDHRSEARRMATNMPVHKWMRSVGLDKIHMEILETLDGPDDIAAKELFWMEQLKTFVEVGGLNVARNGWGGGELPVSDATRIKMKQSAMRRLENESQQQKEKRLEVLRRNGDSRPFLGRHHTPQSIFAANETKRKNGTVPKGDRNPRATMSNDLALMIYHDTRPVSQISLELGLPKGRIWRIKSGESWASVTRAPRSKSNRMPPEKVEEIRRMWREGYRNFQIAEALGISRATVTNVTKGKTHNNKEE